MVYIFGLCLRTVVVVVHQLDVRFTGADGKFGEKKGKSILSKVLVNTPFRTPYLNTRKLDASLPLVDGIWFLHRCLGVASVCRWVLPMVALVVGLDSSLLKDRFEIRSSWYGFSFLLPYITNKL